MEWREAVPRVPERAHLPLLPSSPGGVGRVIATRGTRDAVYSDQLEPMSLEASAGLHRRIG